MTDLFVARRTAGNVDSDFVASTRDVVEDSRDLTRQRELWTGAAQHVSILKREAGVESPGTEFKEMYDELDGAAEAWWTMAHVVRPDVIATVDENVRAALPAGTKVLSIVPSGQSNTSRTAEIQTKLDGEKKSYFLKASDFLSAPVFFRSEFEVLRAMQSAVPGLCVEPLSWGRYASNAAVYFLILSFVKIDHRNPNPETLPKRMAELHWKATSPNGLFGFHIASGGATIPLKLAQSASWEDYLVRHLRFLFRAEEVSQGARPPEMAALLRPLFNRIIPRLLRPLETGGRAIVPRLVHTDLWTGNRAYNEKGEDIIFDPCGIYAHNEFDLGVWRIPRASYGQAYLDNYHAHFEKSAPEEDHEGRNKLYALVFEMRVSAQQLDHDQMFRKEVIRYMRELNESYPESYQEWAVSRGESVCPPKVAYRIGWL